MLTAANEIPSKELTYIVCPKLSNSSFSDSADITNVPCVTIGMILLHQEKQRNMSEKFNKLFADLKKSFGHAGETYKNYANGYSEMRRNFK